MERINQEQFIDAPAKRGKSSIVKYILEQLNVGEGLVIKPEDWPIKTQPNAFINQQFRRQRSSKHFVTKTLVTGGWAVLRVK